MATAPGDSWNRARQAFADQFEKYGNGFVYRRSQKGEAIRVTAEERDKFIDEFNRNIRWGNWILYAGVILVIGAIVLWAVLQRWEVSQGPIWFGIVAVLIPYFAFYRWAWGAPARELAGRTPVAGERSSDDIKRIRFRQITYGQLAGAAFGGLAIPFIGGARHNVLVGWNRLWLLFGAVIVALAAVQAFRKWRFDQNNPNAYEAAAPISADSEPAEEAGSQGTSQLLRYVPLAVLVLLGAFVGFTAVGSQFAAAPSFWPILMAAIGGWALFTVWRGLRNGTIQPFERYVYTTYTRSTQPKRFWASMAWNGFFGCLCLWLAFRMPGWTAGQQVQDRCYNEQNAFSARDVTSACDQLLASASAIISRRPDDASAYFNRGYAYEHRGDLQRAIADFSQVIRLNPHNAGAYYYRWAAYKDLGDDDQAAADFATLSRLDPKLAANIRSIG